MQHEQALHREETMQHVGAAQGAGETMRRDEAMQRCSRAAQRCTGCDSAALYVRIIIA